MHQDRLFLMMNVVHARTQIAKALPTHKTLPAIPSLATELSQLVGLLHWGESGQTLKSKIFRY